jgi:beta-glucanase (GH16 family)
MRADAAMWIAILWRGALLCGCGMATTATGAAITGQAAQTAAPTISTTAALNGAVIVRLSTTTSGATIHYTVDGSTPGASSQIYQAPFLVASNLTVKAVAQASGNAVSSVTSKTFNLDIPSGTLVWSDEFANTTGAGAQPDPRVWTYEASSSPGEEDYCAWGSNTTTCSTASPNAYVGTDGYLHIVARKTSSGVITSARIKTEGLLSLQYGRIEARIKMPESQGMWPAFWLLDNNAAAVNTPPELDVMEHIDGSNPSNEGYDWVQATIHGPGLIHAMQYARFGFSATAWHIYGMIWSKGKIQFYVDKPSRIYATFTPSTQAGAWPFDNGLEFVIFDLAVGGNWPGPPKATTPFPSEMLIDYVRVFTN